jgi:two-component system phosphate regulon sensor histidine kinase PhoR
VHHLPDSRITGPVNISERGRQEPASQPAASAQAESQDAIASESKTTSAAPADISNWIAEVSHELRLPLANIRLLVETLLDGALEDEEVARRMLKRAYQEIERLQGLVVNLLSVEQVAEKRGELKAEWISLRERAGYAADTVAEQANAKDINVKITVGHSAQIFANAAQFDQVLLNLVENAVKFTPKGGTIAIRQGQTATSVAVEDTGIGIASADLPKIFQRFYRVDRGKGSTGLGLSIVKHIAELHNAKIDVESQEGKGSIFELQFPDPRQTEST